jgi:small-conductance mechanosensitive channel
MLIIPSAVCLSSPPVCDSFSMNPIPALIFLLLGLMMSSHHQDSEISTLVHKQWGTLLVCFALARIITYIVFFLSPPKSHFPSRPPSELIAAFCLIAAGLAFMASTRDLIRIMQEYDLMAMFVFTVVVGFTAFLMAYEILVLAVKGWAIRRERPAPKDLPATMTFA